LPTFYNGPDPLYCGYFLMSTNGQYVLIHQNDGDLVVSVTGV
jgi:hypothetical protein